MGRGNSPIRLSRVAGVVLACFFVAFALAGLVGLASIGNLAWTEWRAGHRYVRTTCTVLDKRVEKSRIRVQGDQGRRRLSAGDPHPVRGRGASHEVWTCDSAQLYSRASSPRRSSTATRSAANTHVLVTIRATPGEAVLVRRSRRAGVSQRSCRCS